MSWATDLLDGFYAESLGCGPADLRAGRLLVVETDPRPIRFAKGMPLALYALARPGGAVICAKPGLGGAVTQAVGRSGRLDNLTHTAIERALSPLIKVRFWFRGVRLFCEPDSFVDGAAGEAREVLPTEDENALLLHREWGGKMFGRIVDGKVVSWAAVKPLSSAVWDLSVDTLPSYRGRGYASSAVSAALNYVFANGKLAGWGCDRRNTASLRTARSLGFQRYALDFGCVEDAQQADGWRDFERR